ncbi:MAG TPA: sulfatase [Planctomycetaceae bacterium]|nr:sulfatase [Planctomycetaceae bacterium]
MHAARHILYLLSVFCLFSASVCAEDRPNIVWLLSEDNSVHYMPQYGNRLADTPHLDALANTGMVFEHAFSCAPVCSVARTTLMTGMHAPRVGFQYHRKITPVSLPDGAFMFPVHLRRSGYYVTNKVKTDYNVQVSKVWDESSRNASWRNRPDKETPFFHMQSFGTSHESSLHFPKSVVTNREVTTDPDAVSVPPYYPDTEVFRITLARYHDKISQVDAQIGAVIDQLKSDGLFENTIVFYFGDHGGVLPGSKGYLYETGLHVPLIVHVPEKWQHLSPFGSGSRPNGFVSFIDFAPTVLNLAGIETPKDMDGAPFLGNGITAEVVNKRDTAFGHADRFDEKYDFCRSLRVGRFKYIRNFQQHYADGLQNNYRYRMLAFQQWRELFHEDKLNETQRRFFQAKPAEMLFDLEADPHETKNLAESAEYADKLISMRNALVDKMKEINDLSLFPENEMLRRALPVATTFGVKQNQQISQLIDLNQLALLPFDKAKPHLRRVIKSNNPLKQYWAWNISACFGTNDRQLRHAANALDDSTPVFVRLRAFEYLGICGEEVAERLVSLLYESTSNAEAAMILNTIVFLRDGGFSGSVNNLRIDPSQIKVDEPLVQRRLEYLGFVEIK